MKKETINKIKELKEEGKTIKEVAKALNLPYSTTLYYYNDEWRKKQIKLTIEWKKNNVSNIDQENKKEYQRKYYNKYYHSPEHHERLKKYHREYQRQRYKQNQTN